VSWRDDDDEEEDHDDGRPSATEAAEMGVCCHRGTEYACGLCMCRCAPGPMMLVVTSAMVRATPTIGLFLSDTAAYIASKMWDDLLSSQVFRIVPLPYCGGQYDSRACTELAPASVQFAYSFGLLAVATVLRSLTEKHSHHGLAAVPSMLGMCVGWAFGRAFLAVLVETEADTPWCEEEEHLNQCSTVLTQRGAYAATITVLSALLIVGCQHLAATYRRRVVQGVYLERSGARQRLSVVRVFEALVAMVERAAMTTCSILWNHALSSYVLKGLQPHSEAAARMLLFYSFTMTSGGALLAVASVAQRKRLRARPQLLRVCGGRSLAPALCQMLVILEGTLGWVAGCAWTDFTVAKWSNDSSFPTLWVLGQDVLCALVLSALAAAWLTLTNQGLSVGAEVVECRSTPTQTQTQTQAVTLTPTLTPAPILTRSPSAARRASATSSRARSPSSAAGRGSQSRETPWPYPRRTYATTSSSTGPSVPPRASNSPRPSREGARRSLFVCSRRLTSVLASCGRGRACAHRVPAQHVVCAPYGAFCTERVRPDFLREGSMAGARCCNPYTRLRPCAASARYPRHDVC